MLETKQRNPITLGPIFNGKGIEIYFLAYNDRFSKNPAPELLTAANDPKIEKVLKKYIARHGVPHNIRRDQCLKDNKIQQLFLRININQF